MEPSTLHYNCLTKRAYWPEVCKNELLAALGLLFLTYILYILEWRLLPIVWFQLRLMFGKWKHGTLDLPTGSGLINRLLLQNESALFVKRGRQLP